MPAIVTEAPDPAPEIARSLDSSGHQTNQKALIELVRKVQVRGLIPTGDPAVLAARYIAVLWGRSHCSAINAGARGAREIEIHTRAATDTLTALRVDTRP